MKILLTGSRGFIGTRLSKILEEANHEVIGIDLLDGNNLLDCSLEHEVDLVIHLAGKSGVRESLQDPGSYWLNNVEASRRLFSRYKNTRILYASSSTVYEPNLNPYANSKRVIEEIAPINSLGLRFHTVYDYNSRSNMFMYKLLNNQLEYVTNHSRDFIHIDDACEAVMKIIYHTSMCGYVDVGTGVSVFIRDLVEDDLLIKEQTPEERIHTQADIKILESIGFKPKYSVINFLNNHKKKSIIKTYGENHERHS